MKRPARARLKPAVHPPSRAPAPHPRRAPPGPVPPGPSATPAARPLAAHKRGEKHTQARDARAHCTALRHTVKACSCVLGGDVTLVLGRRGWGPGGEGESPRVRPGRRRREPALAGAAPRARA